MPIFRLLPAALLALVFSAGALAQRFDAVDTIPYPSSGVFPAYPGTPEDPRAFWMQLGVVHDTNVLRLAGGGPNEQVTRFGVGVRRDIRVVGRQTLRLAATGEGFLYNEFGQLDHLAYGLLGEWRWELGNDLSGTLGFTRRRYQADLAEIRAPIEDLISENRLYGSAAYRLGPSFRLRGGADFVDTERPRRDIAESGGYSTVGGIDYVTALGNSLGVEARYTRGDAPVLEPLIVAPGTLVNNDYEQKEVAAVLVWNPGAFLRTAGRIGQTERSYTQLPGRDFSGATWSALVEFLPGNKTILAGEIYKRVSSVLDIAASHVVSKGYAVGPSWAPTAKLSFYLRYVDEDRDFEGDPNVPLGGPLRAEELKTWRIGAGWEVTRQWNFGVALERGRRESSLAGFDYRYTAAMANLRYDF